MNSLLFKIIVIALSRSGEWPEQKFTSFCKDVEPLLHKVKIDEEEIYPLYDNYIHSLDKIYVVLNLEKITDPSCAKAPEGKLDV